MSDLSPTVVAQRLADLSRDLDTAQRALDMADRDAVNARHAHEIAYARAVLSAEGGNAETRKAHAVLATADLSYAAECADQVVRSTRVKISVLRSQLDTGRSIGAALRDPS